MEHVNTAALFCKLAALADVATCFTNSRDSLATLYAFFIYIRKTNLQPTYQNFHTFFSFERKCVSRTKRIFSVWQNLKRSKRYIASNWKKKIEKLLKFYINRTLLFKYYFTLHFQITKVKKSPHLSHFTRNSASKFFFAYPHVIRNKIWI